MQLWIAKAVELLVLPPGVFILAGVVGLLLLRRAARLAVLILACMLLAMYALSLPRLASTVAMRLAGTNALQALDLSAGVPDGAGAIVVLGGGRRKDAAEYAGEDTVSNRTLERLRYAAHVQRATGLDVLVTGGSPFEPQRLPESALMRAVLEQDFSVPVRWEESASRTTAENASYSAIILADADIDKVLLVTHALHMPRAVESFEAAGVAVIPAPFALPTLDPHGWTAFDFLPRMDALRISWFSLHEVVGRWWYRWKGVA